MEVGRGGSELVLQRGGKVFRRDKSSLRFAELVGPGLGSGLSSGELGPCSGSLHSVDGGLTAQSIERSGETSAIVLRRFQALTGQSKRLRGLRAGAFGLEALGRLCLHRSSAAGSTSGEIAKQGENGSGEKRGDEEQPGR